MPPLVVTPPAAPKKVEPPPKVVKEVAPPPPKVEALPAIVATMPEPPAEAVPPVVEVPPVKAVSATPVSLAKPTRPALAEIIAFGPKPVDASAAFRTALNDAKAAQTKIRDCSGHMLLQERIKGQLQPEQTAELRMKSAPRSIAVKFIAPGSLVGREIVFADGRHTNKVRAKAAGTYGPLAFATVPMSDAKAAVSTRHTLADIGPAAILERVERALAMESKLRNPVSVLAADFAFAGKTVTRFDVSFDRPHALRDCARCVVCIDPDTKLPVRLEIYDAPFAGKLDGDLREAVSFVNFTFNQGLNDAVFEK